MRVALPKGPTRKTIKTRKKRAERAVISCVRAACVERDGYCRVAGHGPCAGPSEWVHLPPRTRAQTRGMTPERRHSSAWTLMACRQHHNRIDGRQRPRLTVAPWSNRDGADGPLVITAEASAA